MRAMRQEVVQRTLLPSHWRFEPGPRPCIVREQTEDMLIHEGGEELTSISPIANHRFRYRGRFGDFVLPVAVKPVWDFADRPRPPEWDVDYVPALQVRRGESRARLPDGTIRDTIAGEARLSEREWLAFNRIVVEGLLSGRQARRRGGPALGQRQGGYREGEWDGMPWAVIGPNAEATGLFIAS